MQNDWLTFKTKAAAFIEGKRSIIYVARCQTYKEEITYCACINRQAFDMNNTTSRAPPIHLFGFNIDVNKQGKSFPT